MMSDCKELAEDVLMGIYEKHFGAKKKIEYLELAIKLEKMRPTDKDGAKLKELTSELKEASEAYYAGLTPMCEEKKRLRDIVHAWPEYVAASRAYEEAREGYETAYKVFAEKKEFNRQNCSEFDQRNKNAGGELGMPMLLVKESRYVAGLKADCDALAQKVREAEEAFTAYKESIKYHYIARGMLEAMNDFE